MRIMRVFAREKVMLDVDSPKLHKHDKKMSGH